MENLGLIIALLGIGLGIIMFVKLLKRKIKFKKFLLYGIAALVLIGIGGNLLPDDEAATNKVVSTEDSKIKSKTDQDKEEDNLTDNKENDEAKEKEVIEAKHDEEEGDNKDSSSYNDEVNNSEEFLEDNEEKVDNEEKIDRREDAVDKSEDTVDVNVDTNEEEGSSELAAGVKSDDYESNYKESVEVPIVESYNWNLEDLDAVTNGNMDIAYEVIKNLNEKQVEKKATYYPASFVPLKFIYMYSKADGDDEYYKVCETVINDFYKKHVGEIGCYSGTILEIDPESTEAKGDKFTMLRIRDQFGKDILALNIGNTSDGLQVGDYVNIYGIIGGIKISYGINNIELSMLSKGIEKIEDRKDDLTNEFVVHNPEVATELIWWMGNDEISRHPLFASSDLIKFNGDEKEQKSGKKMIVYYTNGTKYYEGGWKNGMPEGKGIKYYRNGDIAIKGEFKEGKLDDKFKMYFKNNMLAAEGKAKSGRFHGKVKIYYINGNKAFEGKFDEGKIDGDFTHYFEDGQVHFKGTSKKDLWHGYGIEGDGVEYYQNGNIKYKGKFKNGQYEGKGKLYYENGKINYEGQFKDNKFHGDGKLYNENGEEIYEGEWKKGKYIK